MKTALVSARESLQETVTWLNGLEQDESFALGTKLFGRMLWKTERVDTPLAELKTIGEADLARNLAFMRTACCASSLSIMTSSRSPRTTR